MTEKKKIGFYGGSFDPIHFGHLNLAVDISEAHQLDEVWFCPANINPHKTSHQTAPFKDRVEMVALALEGFPNFKVIDLEIKREAPSYTIDTLDILLRENNNLQIGLIIGDDTLLDFHRWHRVKDIIEKIPVYIGNRLTNLAHVNLEDPQLLAAVQKGITHTHVIEISATEIRQRLAKGLNCRHLSPAKVIDYILAHQLYLSGAKINEMS